MSPRADLFALGSALLVACGGTGSNQSSGHDAGARDAAADAGAPSHDASPDARADGPSEASETSGPPDGTPTYTSACTPLSSQTGTAIDTSHGRLDGYLSFVVPIGGSSACNGDDSHVHLQITMDGNIYDVAVDTGRFSGDVLLYETNMPIPDGAWSEGWHGTDALTYTSLGIHSTQFTPEVPAALGTKLQAELAGVNHISVFGTGYAQGNGCHDVHYEDGNGNDGALVLEPLSATSHVIFFRFSTDTF
jgi:hypothetical protein